MTREYGRKFVLVVRVEPGEPVRPEDRDKLSYEPHSIDNVLAQLFDSKPAQRMDYQFTPISIYRVDKDIP